MKLSIQSIESFFTLLFGVLFECRESNEAIRMTETESFSQIDQSSMKTKSEYIPLLYCA